MAVLTRVKYVGDDATHEWLKTLAKQPGQVWVEMQGKNTVIVHEFEDQRRIENERDQQEA